MENVVGSLMTKIEVIMSCYPETGIVNTDTKIVLDGAMLDFLNKYILTYRDYPDSKIANEFAEKIWNTQRVCRRDRI